MRRLWASVVAMGLVAAAPAELDPGPAPTWREATALGEQTIRANLIDPDSAKIEWPFDFTGGTLKALFGKTRAGWWTCGFVNAKNRMGGYAGRSWFMIMVNAGQVVSFDISSDDDIGPASATCPGAVKKGLFKPAPAAPTSSGVATFSEFQAAAASNATIAASKGGLGISFVPSPYGAMLVAVAPDSVAARAGLRPGETIEMVNGVPLKGLPADAMIKVVQGPSGTVTLSVIGVGEVKLVRPGQ